ncbi:PTS transporter subunit EIIC [Lactobacillus sp. ESL0677]|uniref:PTS sugar transporter subunit IIC n=1 Tax=Lactobacillus sp. ESL0677 TaxID=2983208 RepID=UPI0023F9DAA6|nr:PTS transporter subunit EIIC [Lactobacillus sp. ESL0677]WEV37417.1 PTS transporter subunit EIIC [Lactobacillus sp. ESL0677]
MKEKMTKFFDKITPFLNKVGANKYLQTIMAAMLEILGPIILGSFAVLGSVWSAKYHLTGVTNALNAVSAVTINGMALYIAFLIAKHLVPYFIKGDDGSAAGIISLMVFLILVPLGQIKDKGAVITAIPTTWLSSQGVFSAIIVGVLVAKSYVFMKQHNWTIKMPAGVPPMVSASFANLIPAVVDGIVALLINYLFALTSWGSFHQMIFSIIQTPLQNIGGSIWAMILVSLLMQILWFFGIHGTNVINPIVMPIWMALDMQNLVALKAGKPLPNIIGMAFFNVVTWSGTALGLVLLMVFIGKSKRYKELGKLALIPSLFGITEPTVFGTPLVLNFNFAVPFITNNTIAIIISYLAIKLGIVARFSGVQTTFGLPLGVFAAVEGSASIIVLQLFIQLVLSPLLWYPWFKHADKIAVQEEQKG